MADTVDKAVYILSYQTGDSKQQLDAVKRSSDAVVESAERLAVTEEKVTRATRASGDELAKIAARYDQRTRLEQRLVAEQARMQRLEKEGIGTTEERARVSSLVEASIRRQINDLDRQDSALRKSAQTTGLVRHEMINLGRQIQDVGVSLASGQSPLTVLVQQGAQVLDIFASMRGTLGGVFNQFISGAGRFVTSAAGIAVGVASIGLAAAAAAISWNSAQKDIERSLAGIGRASGLTVGDVNRIAAETASATRLSTSEAREALIEFMNTGRIYAQNAKQASLMTDDFARAMGVDAAKGAKELAAALADPIKGAEQLNAKFGFLDERTRLYIESLTKQNRIQEAQKALMDAMGPSIARAAELTSGWAKAWDAVTKAASEAATAVGKALAPASDEDKLAAARERQAALMMGTGRRRDISPGRVAAESMRGEDVALKAVNAEIERLEENLRKAAAEAANARQNLESIAQAKIVRDISPEIAQFQELRNRAIGLGDILRKIQDTGGAQSPILEKMGLSMEQVALAADRAKSALDTALTPAQRLTAEFENSKAAITAQTQAERVSLAGRVEATRLAGQNLSLQERVLAVSRAQTLEATKLSQAHRDSMAALQDQLKVAEARTGTARLAAQEEATYNELIRQGRTQMEAATEAALQRKIAVEQANRAVDDQIISLRQAVEMERARLEGTEASVAAAQAYANAMRSGASETKAAALAAATLEANLERAQIAAEQLAMKMASAAASGSGAFGINDLARRLDAIGTGSGGARNFTIQWSGQPGSIVHTQGGGGGPLVGAAGASTSYIRNDFIGEWTYEYAEQRAAEARARWAQEAQQAAQKQEDAARAAQDAANAAQDAANAQREAAEAMRAAQDAYVSEEAARRIFMGEDPRVTNALIEAGQLRAATPSITFQTQLDLYKRAGMSPAQIAADIRRGVIGEGVPYTELLAALDSLTDAVTSNTEAQMIGLSEFYTQQGDRLVGYRGFGVQSPRTASISGGITGTGTGTAAGDLVGGMPGAVINNETRIYYPPPGTTVTSSGGGTVSVPSTGAGPYTQIGPNPTWGNYQPTYNQNIIPRSLALVDYTQTTQSPYTNVSPQYLLPFAGGGIMTSRGRMPLHMYQGGGVAYGPQMAMFGEGSRPEAFVPLESGAIPVRLSQQFAGGESQAGQGMTLVRLLSILATAVAKQDNNKPAVTINAPLIHFASEPSRDDVRESAFQGAQMLRRVITG